MILYIQTSFLRSSFRYMRITTINCVNSAECQKWSTLFHILGKKYHTYNLWFYEKNFANKGLTSWCPTNLQHLCWKTLINKVPQHAWRILHNILTNKQLPDDESCDFKLVSYVTYTTAIAVAVINIILKTETVIFFETIYIH